MDIGVLFDKFTRLLCILNIEYVIEAAVVNIRRTTRLQNMVIPKKVDDNGI